MTLPITTLLTSLLAIWLVILSFNIVAQRRNKSISLGDGGDETFERKIRAHGNLTEYAPIMTLLVGLAEFQAGSFYVVSLSAAVFFVARIAHGYALGFSSYNPKGRIYGMLFTFIPIIIMAFYNLMLLTL